MTRLLSAIAADLGFRPDQLVVASFVALIGAPLAFGLAIGLLIGLAVAP